MLKEMNQKVFSRHLELLRDKLRKVKINVCKAITDSAKPSRLILKYLKPMEAMIFVAEHDLDGFVRKEAERCAHYESG